MMQRVVQSVSDLDSPKAANLENHESSFLDPLFFGLTDFAMKFADRIEAEEERQREATRTTT